MLHHGADAVIHIREHGSEDATVHVVDVSEFFHVGIGSLERAVHGVVGKEEERFVVVAINEVDGFAGEGVGEVFRFDHRLSAANDGVVGIVVRLVAEQIVEMEFLVAVPIARFSRTTGQELRRSKVVVPSQGGGTK